MSIGGLGNLGLIEFSRDLLFYTTTLRDTMLVFLNGCKLLQGGHLKSLLGSLDWIVTAKITKRNVHLVKDKIIVCLIVTWSVNTYMIHI